MNNALQNLEAFRGNEYQGILVQSAEPWEILVVRGLQPVTTVPLTPTESQHLKQALYGTEARRPLVYYRMALRQGQWVAGAAMRK